MRKGGNKKANISRKLLKTKGWERDSEHKSEERDQHKQFKVILFGSANARYSEGTNKTTLILRTKNSTLRQTKMP